MACFRPIVAFKPDDGGPILFSERKGYREIQIPCGQCIGCRIRKREEWAIRCYCESKMHRDNHFATLTYDDEHLPADGSLDYSHFQLLVRYMRRKFGKFRFFMCGEYGDNFGRPHYHALFFGLNLPDLVKCNSVHSSCDVFTSETVSKLWGRGFVSFGSVTYESARYCAVYTTKRVTGPAAADHYTRVVPATGELVCVSPEFARMSLKPGIGLPWLTKYWRDVYARGELYFPLQDKRKPVPRYFDSMMDEIAAEVMDDITFDRWYEAQKYAEHRTRERLEVREAVALSRQSFNRERYNNAV